MIELPITVYAPNLPQRPERKHSIYAQFAGRTEFALNIIPAIERKQPTWGLWQTFYKIVEQEKKKDSDFFIFCEDDHVFTENYSKDFLLDCIVKADEMKADILSGGMSVTINPVQVYDHLFWVDVFNGMQFTVVFNRCYDRILAAKTDKGYTLDFQLSYLAKTKFNIFPYISVQKDFGYSDATEFNNETGKVERFFAKVQTSLEKLDKIRKFYNQLPHSARQKVYDADVSASYIPTFVINLKERADRRKHILQEFEGRDEFQVQLVEAAKGENGAVGLWMSICNIIQQAKDTDEDFVLICEDDHVFTPNYNREKFLRQVMLAGAMGTQLLNGGVGGFSNLVPLSHGLFWIDKFWCTQFIVVYKCAYDIILNTYFSVRDVADEKLSSILTNKLLIGPFISEQTDFGYSDVTEANNSIVSIRKYFDESRLKYTIFQHAEKYLNFSEDYVSPYLPISSCIHTNQANLLQLGCGNNLLKGWINTDLEPVQNALFMDVLQPFPLPEACIDYVFSEHLLNELSLESVNKLLKECDRVLKPGGLLRFTFYTAENFLHLHSENEQADEYVRWCLKRKKGNAAKKLLTEAPCLSYSLALNYFKEKTKELMLYDYSLIEYLLKQNGFQQICRCRISESAYLPLKGIEQHKVYIPQEIYQYEVTTIEATKL